MKKLFAALTLSLWFVANHTGAHAAIQLSFDPNATFTQGSGIREVSFLARSTNPIDDQLFSITVDFQVTGATFSLVSDTDFVADNYDPNPMSPTFGRWFSSGLGYTKLFNEADYIGFENLNKEGGSFLRTKTILVAQNLVSDPTAAALSLEFNDPRDFPDVATRLGKLRIDISGLATGQYPIDFTRIQAYGVSTTIVPSSSMNGFFTITAIPEPTSFTMVLGVLLLGIISRQSRFPDGNRPEIRAL